MKKLSLFIIFIFFVSGNFLFAQEKSAGPVRAVSFVCNDIYKCEDLKESFQERVLNSKNDMGLYNVLSSLLQDEKIKSFNFLNENKKLIININFFRTLNKIDLKLNTDINEDLVKRALSLKKGMRIIDFDKEAIRSEIISFMGDKGFKVQGLNFKFVKSENGDDLIIDIKVKDVLRINKINIVFKDKGPVRIKGRFRRYRGKNWDRAKIKKEINELSTELFTRGFYFSNVSLENVKILEEVKVNFDIVITFGKKINFSIIGNNYVSRKEIIDSFLENIKSRIGAFQKNQVNQIIDNIYGKKGFYNVDSSTYVYDGETLSGLKISNYYINIKENLKSRLGVINFKGVSNKHLNAIEKMFFEGESILVSRGYLDKNFISDFTQKIKKYYYSNGHLFVKVSPPTYELESGRTNVVFKVKERLVTKNHSIQITKDKEDFEPQFTNIYSKLKNKINEPIDVNSVDSDIAIAIKEVRNLGYFYASLASQKTNEIIVYENNYSQSNLNLQIIPGDRVYFNDLVIVGLKRTKKEVILREVKIKSGDLISPDKLEKFKFSLLSLGLFSFVRITPNIRKIQGDKHFYDLIIQVKEKDHGSVEIAPGYRTDIGLKASLSLAYNNVGGKNRIAKVKLQVNRRLDLDTLDSTRRARNRNLIEYSVGGNYSDPYLFNRHVEFNFSASQSRKRYFSFDADVTKGSFQFSKLFSDFVLTSFKYQFETISQFEATNSKDSGFFKIGGITPSLSLDFRDNKISPRKGALLGLSVEYANPFLGSLDKEEEEINFFKVISRNKFYYSLGRFTFAFSYVAGMQKNLAEGFYTNSEGLTTERGSIPSIKLFRLDGVDTIRGFSPSESNRLDIVTKQDILDIDVSGTAYLSSFKFEPRYRYSDSITFGPFFDAGRLFVDHFKPLSLRTAVGFTLKFNTPVGSLDFDYGVKLNRQDVSASQKERFGRFHLSIGTF